MDHLLSDRSNRFLQVQLCHKFDRLFDLPLQHRLNHLPFELLQLCHRPDLVPEQLPQSQDQKGRLSILDDHHLDDTRK